MKIIIETEEKYVPVFRALAKALGAKARVAKEETLSQTYKSKPASGKS